MKGSSTKRALLERAPAIAALLLPAACGGGGSDAPPPGGGPPPPPPPTASVRELLRLPEHYEEPAIPAYNPLTAEKIELGRRLFYDVRLSGNQTQSCASCHLQSLGFTDAKITPSGSTGDVLPRNSQGLANDAYFSTMTWASNVLLDVEDQIHVPIESDNPIKLGVLDGNRRDVLDRFEADEAYRRLFAEAFPEEEETVTVTVNKIVFALASFCRTLVSADSPFDRYYLGDTSALTEQQIQGLRLFNSEQFECFHCHQGINFSIAYRDTNTTPGTILFPFFNNGLYNVGGRGRYPQGNEGLYELTGDPFDRGMFRPSGLRNVAVTAPYMHDGSIATLREVVMHYVRGGRLIESGPNAGDGRLNPLKSGLVRSFEATDEEIDAVVAFLESLTDETFLKESRFSDPFAGGEP